MEEAGDAERQLSELRREAQLRRARCEGQLETLARDAKEEQERWKAKKKKYETYIT